MNMADMLMLVQGTTFNNIWHGGVKFALLGVMALCALFIIIVVLFQPGNTSGIGALSGQQDTFLEKNKSKTFEHKMKKITVISGIILVVLCIVFAVIAAIFPA
ncbi:MAG: preprotein translocase subunit SecG [Clostridia bacterium]|jgi:preprotein translocase subunit SecG|nr:preprotein translocase subunit SecG [Clostridia bacterium]